MKVSVEIVNAFIDGDSGGTPAGVVLDANPLTAQQKLIVAQKVGLSETAFVSNSEVATIKLEFFTPVQQIAHCGHATIATFSRMSELGLVQNGRMSKETVDGTREIIIDGSMAFMEQSRPIYTDVLNTEEVRAALNLSSDVPLHSISIVNTGNAFLLVPLHNASSVAEIQPNQDLIKKISAQYDLIGFYVFSSETTVPGRHAGARMFAPRYGIDEEAATGMAAGPLACYLHDRKGIDETTLFIEQGHLMHPPSGSVISVDLQLGDGCITRLMAGGVGRSLQQIEMEI